MLIRKIKEAFLVVRIEQLLSKDEIPELYLNKICLGYHAYGVSVAALVYFGKDIGQLSLSAMVMIAGLLRAPSTFNPFYSSERALARICDENYITQAGYEQACDAALVVHFHALKIDCSVPYVSEMVRQDILKHHGGKYLYRRLQGVYHYHQGASISGANRGAQ